MSLSTSLEKSEAFSGMLSGKNSRARRAAQFVNFKTFRLQSRIDTKQ